MGLLPFFRPRKQVISYLFLQELVPWQLDLNSPSAVDSRCRLFRRDHALKPKNDKIGRLGRWDLLTLMVGRGKF